MIDNMDSNHELDLYIQLGDEIVSECIHKRWSVENIQEFIDLTLKIDVAAADTKRKREVLSIKYNIRDLVKDLPVGWPGDDELLYEIQCIFEMLGAFTEQVLDGKVWLQWDDIKPEYLQLGKGAIDRLRRLEI